MTHSDTSEPNNVVSLNNLGMQYSSQNRMDKALHYLKKAIKISDSYPQPWRNLGLIYSKLGQPKKAITCFEKAISINPNYPLSYIDLGITANFAGDQQKAINTFLKWADIEPVSPWPYQNLASFYFQSSDYEKAVQYYKKTIERDQNFAKGYNGLFLSYRMLCDWRNAELIEKQLDRFHDEDPYVSLIRSEDLKKNYLAARKASERIIVDTPKLEFSYTKTSRKKIRIGYLSRDFICHVIEEEMLSLFKFHNRDDFEVYVYSYHGNQNDSFSKILEKDCDRYIDISGLSDVEAARLINEDRIDILIDLMGYTLGSRLGICAMRPAPVQATWLGFPGTTGAVFFDYTIVDRIVLSEKEGGYFSEIPAYLPNCFQINYLNEDYSKNVLKKAHFGLPERSFIFSSFNRAYKFEPVMFKVWMEILKKTQDSVLWLSDPGLVGQKNLKNFAKDQSVDPNRIIFSKRLHKKSDHLRKLALTDLALDTYIFGGHLTTSDYLKAGVPVLTRKGDHLISRVSSSILTTYGVPELITNSLKEYKKLAIEIASNKNKLKEIKSKITVLKKNNVLFDTKAFTKNLEKMYKEMWNTYKDL